MSSVEMDDTPLVKARAAVAAAKLLLDNAELEHSSGLLQLKAAEEFARLMRVAEVQACIATAEFTAVTATATMQVVERLEQLAAEVLLLLAKP